MPFTSPATVVTLTTITTAWGNSVKAAADYLANPPSIKVARTTNQSVNNGTQTSVIYNASDLWDTPSGHSTSTNPERITVPDAGLYLIGAHVNWAANATGDRVVFLSLFGVGGIPGGAMDIPAVAGGRPTEMVVQTLTKFTAGQTFTVETFQTFGGALNIASSYAWCVWVGLG